MESKNTLPINCGFFLLKVEASLKVTLRSLKKPNTDPNAIVWGMSSSKHFKHIMSFRNQILVNQKEGKKWVKNVPGKSATQLLSGLQGQELSL